MTGLEFVFSVLGATWPFIILAILFSILQALKSNCWDDVFWRDAFFEKLKSKFGVIFNFVKQKWENNISLHEFRRVREFFDTPRQFLSIKQNGIHNTVQYAVKGVDANMFQNFILSGKATLHTLDGMFLSDNVLNNETFDAHRAIIGICRTKHSGLVFYPASKKDYRAIVSFLEKKQKTKVRQNDIMQKIQDIQTKQECDAANNQRMQDFIKEFAEETVEENTDAPEEPTLHLDQEMEAIDLKPNLQL